MKETAKNMAVVSQESSSSFDFSVREIVLMGRVPHKKMLETDNAQDGRIVDEALEKVDLFEYENRSIAKVSGGKKQRVMVARALAQQAKVLERRYGSKKNNYVATQVEDTTGNVRVTQGLEKLAKGFYPEKFE